MFNIPVTEATGYLATVNCSACGDQINTSKKGDARRHPELSVLICKVRELCSVKITQYYVCFVFSHS